MLRQWPYKPIYFALIFFLFALTQLSACGEDVEKTSRRNLETGVVRIDLDGHYFNVPVSYMYHESNIKRGMWATPKKGRTEVGYLGFSVLLPDLRPYYPEDDARWKVRGHGDRVFGSIMKDNTKNFELTVKGKFDGVAKGRSQREKDVYGLIHFSPKGYGMDDYLPVDSRELRIFCSKAAPPDNVPFPGCTVISNYREGIVLNYNYGRPYLSRWREIDDGIKVMFDKFAEAAEAEKLK